MNYTKRTLLSLLVVSGMFTSCEKEELGNQELSFANDTESTTLEAPEFIRDDRELTKIASLGVVKGEFGGLYIQKYGGQVVTLNDLSEYNPKTTGYLHYDIDGVDFTEEEYKELKRWADKNDASIIFESGSKNATKMKEFYATYIVDTYPSYNVDGVIIENSSKTPVTRTTVISDEISWSFEDLITFNFNGLKPIVATNIAKSPSYVTPTTVKTYPDKRKRCVRGRCTTIWGTPLYTTTNKFMDIPANSNYKVTGVKYSNVSGSMKNYGVVKRTPLKFGYVHDAKLYNGGYTCNQTASYAEGITYTKSWTVGLGAASGAVSKFFPSLVKKIQDAAFSISPSIGYSKAEGVVNTTSLAMKEKRFARGVVYATIFERNLGYWKGTVEYTVHRYNPSGNVRNKWRKLYNAKSIFNGYGADNSWASDQPHSPSNNRVTRLSFGWDQWGEDLNCD